MYAHRATVRRAWGGDPADCAAHFAARPTMTASELAGVLAGPPLLMPDDWRRWPVTRAAHLLLAERALATMPPYPHDHFAGRGAVICGGGRYEAAAYVACRMLRHVGWHYPIQVWHRGGDEPVSARIRGLPGVEVVDAEAHPARADRRLFGGWQAKTLAIINCPFEEVLFLDADCYPIANPDICFDPAHNPHGIVTWPDGHVGDCTPQWDSYGLTPDGCCAINGGHYVFTKRRAWAVLHLAQHYDNHSDYYYCQSKLCAGDVGGYGDQDQVRVALHKLGIPSHRYTQRPIACAHESYLQAGPHGRPLFVHRHFNKFAAAGQFAMPPKWWPGHLPMEATAWRYFLEWMTDAVDIAACPAEVPGWFTPAECALWSRCCHDRHVIELGRYHGRSTIVAAGSAASVVSLDRQAESAADFWLQRYRVRHKVWLRRGEFATLVPTSGGPFSACLIDGDHDRAHVEADINAVLPYLTASALIGFHDYGDPAHPDVQPTVDAASHRHGWRFVERAGFLGVFEVV
jgi:hypothetical protein